MPPVPPQPVQLACPNCRNPIRTAIYTLIDVSQQPELKQALLAGQLNVAVCANCGFASMLGAPLVYHDAEKQLCLVYFPQELNARPEEQERFIGETTSVIIRGLPADAPRGYLLTPRRFMSLPSLLDAILEADGISRETIEQQRRRITLISQFAGALEDEEQFARLVEQHRDELTYEFFGTLSAFIEASNQGGRDDSAVVLEQVREKLVELTGFTGEEGEEGDADLATVIARLREAPDDELDGLIAELRPAIDYSFFEAWTALIEELEGGGEQEEAARLTARRTYILEAVERMDREAQELFEAGASVLREVLDAPDLKAALQAQGDKIGEAFLLVVSANQAAAERAGNAALAARLEEISRLAVEVIQENLSPEERFINELLLAENPKDSTRLLRQNIAQVTPAFVKKLNELAEQEEKRGVKPAAERLRQLAREAGAMLF